MMGLSEVILEAILRIIGFGFITFLIGERNKWDILKENNSNKLLF
ncbi:hypothetical protein ORL93_26210 [Bacillus sp. DHT2]|nr:hypothetical protein [Bacillus sp. DHT2]MCX2829167.1 hypothetical protein [Bacillus sp. DHT2]